MAYSARNQDGVVGYSAGFCIPHLTSHILLIISSGNWIKANSNGEVKNSKFSTMCEINRWLHFDVRLQDVGEKQKGIWAC